ncbi:MAG: cytochrome c [Pseudomonadota bacterium]|nr:cytochrome c [Pseudomonadota bacterium]
MKNIHTLLIGSMLAGLLAASSPAYAHDDDDGDTKPVKVKTAKTPKKPPVVLTAPSVTPVLVTAAALSSAGEGRRLYLKLNCYGCHGDRGAGGMGPKVAHAEYGDVSEKVLQGAGEGMISYKAYVTTQDVSNIAAYLASIGQPDEPKFKDWWVPVPTK